MYYYQCHLLFQKKFIYIYICLYIYIANCAIVSFLCGVILTRYSDSLKHRFCLFFTQN